jgi:hypothetical protein
VSLSRMERFAPLSGVVFIVLFVVSAAFVGDQGYLSSPTDLEEMFTDDSTQIDIGGFLAVLSAAFLIWFAGSLRHSLRLLEGGTERLSALALGGGVAAGAFTALAGSVVRVAAQRGGSDSGISADSAVVFSDIANSVGGVALPVALAVMIAASAAVMFRTGAWPTWLAWASVVIAVGSLTPLSYIFLAAELLWILVVSIFLVMRGADESTATAAGGG